MSRNTRSAATTAAPVPSVEDTDEFRQGSGLNGPSETLTQEEVTALAERMAERLKTVALAVFKEVLRRGGAQNRAYVEADLLREFIGEDGFGRPRKTAITRHIQSLPEERQESFRGFMIGQIKEAQTEAGRNVRYLPEPLVSMARRQQPVGDEAAVNG